MRIVYFSECFHPTHNGVVISMDTFKAGLEALGHEVFIVTPEGEEIENDPKVIRLSSYKLNKDYPIAKLHTSQKLIDKITAIKPDIIHCQHMFETGNLGLKISKLLNIPMVYTYHTLLTDYTHYVPIVPNFIKEKVVIKWSRNFCNEADQVVTPSTPMKEKLTTWGVKKPISVIPTGIPLDQFKNPYTREELNEDWQVPMDKTLLLYLSRVAPEKNIQLLFKAVQILKKKNSNFHLLMVGGGPDLEIVKKMTNDLNINDVVTFTGEQKKPGSARFYGAADIFTFPSFTETQGIVIAEAMTCGVPAVAVNRLGPKDIVRDGINGYLTDLKLSSFTDKIESLIKDKVLRKKLGEQAKIDAKKFSVEATVSKMEKLYEQAIENRQN